MGNMLISIEIVGGSASEDQKLVNDLASFVKAHAASPSTVKVVGVHAGFYRAEA